MSSFGIEDRRESAKRRQEERAKRSPLEQLQRLDSLLGKGEGAKRERARLEALIAKEKTSAKEKH